MVFQTEVQSGWQGEMAGAINARQPLTPLAVTFCAQVLVYQYFSRINPDRPARNLFKTEILQNRSVFFF
jgi:hypothetical protein